MLQSNGAHAPATDTHHANDATPELCIVIQPDDRANYIGTAAQLEAEGLIPPNFKWPSGATYQHWEAGGYSYSLRRIRPAQHKGPMRTWLTLDHWSLSVYVTGRDYRWYEQRKLERQAEALRAEYHRRTAVGMSEWDAAWRRYRQAVQDQNFQAFKSMVPALAPPKRAPRKAKAGAVSKEASHA